MNAVAHSGTAFIVATGASLVVWGTGLLAVPTTRRLAARALRRDVAR
jgi:hypothetical protein